MGQGIECDVFWLSAAGRRQARSAPVVRWNGRTRTAGGRCHVGRRTDVGRPVLRRGLAWSSMVRFKKLTKRSVALVGAMTGHRTAVVCVALVGSPCLSSRELHGGRLRGGGASAPSDLSVLRPSERRRSTIARSWISRSGPVWTAANARGEAELCWSNRIGR
jgi:hypothetical protein